LPTNPDAVPATAGDRAPPDIRISGWFEQPRRSDTASPPHIPHLRSHRMPPKTPAAASPDDPHDRDTSATPDGNIDPSRVTSAPLSGEVLATPAPSPDCGDATRRTRADRRAGRRSISDGDRQLRQIRHFRGFPNLGPAVSCGAGRLIGQIGELIVQEQLLSWGYRCFAAPDDAPYDLVLDVFGRLVRVQVKATGTSRPERTEFATHVRRGNTATGIGTFAYHNGDFDMLAVVLIPHRQVRFFIDPPTRVTVSFDPDQARPADRDGFRMCLACLGLTEPDPDYPEDDVDPENMPDPEPGAA
jgi:hypothetical protein